MDDDTPIYTTSQTCNRLFVEILNKPDAASALVAEVLHMRFTQWTSYLGVFAQENMSLDTRLQYSQSISQLILQFLQIVFRNLERVGQLDEALEQTNFADDDLQQSIAEEVNHAPESGASSPLAESLRAIKAAIDGLYRLGAAIRQSSSSTLDQRVSKFIEANDDLAIENLVFLRLKHKFFDKDVTKGGCKSPLSLYKQLATSISFRYFGIRYRQHRQNKFGKKREVIPIQHQTQEKKGLPQDSDQLRKMDDPNKLKKLAVANARIKRQPGTEKEDPPTTVHSKSILERYAATEKSFAQAKSVLSSHMKESKYPDAPKVDTRTREANCPFCAKPITEMNLRKNDWWHRHVDQDLKLYTCLSERCAEPPQFFIHFQEWKSHMDENHTTNWMREIHKPLGWCCDVEHDDQYFEDEVEYDQHVQEFHAEYEAEKAELKEWGELQRERPEYTCPICNCVPIELASIYPWLDEGKLAEPEATKTDVTPPERGEIARNKLLLHIGTHLKQLGLMSVAYVEDDASENAMESKRGSIFIDEDGKILFIADPPGYFDPQYDGHIQQKEPDVIEDAADWSEVRNLSMEHDSTDFDDDPILQNFWKFKRIQGHSHNLIAQIGGRFSGIKTITELDKSIQLEQESIDAIPPDHLDRAEHLRALGAMFSERYLRSGDKNDIKVAIRTIRKALDIIPQNHPDRPTLLNNVGAILHEQYLITKKDSDFEMAIQAIQMAADGTPDIQPERIVYLNARRILLSDKYLSTRELGDLDIAINAARQVITITPDDYLDRFTCLSGLGDLLSRRFERTGSLNDLDEAIAITASAIDAASRDILDVAVCLYHLGTLLSDRFHKTGSIADLNQAISNTLEAVDRIPPNHPDRSLYLRDAAALLGERFTITRAMDDLNKAITLMSEAIDSRANIQLGQAVLLSDLGSLLCKRFDQTMAIEDLDQAVSTARSAVDATPSHYLEIRSSRLRNLATMLRKRFRQTGLIGDLEEAIDITITIFERRSDLELIDLYYTGDLIGGEYEETAQMSDLNELIDEARDAKHMVSRDDPRFTIYAKNLGALLNLRFEQTGSIRHLDEAINAAQDIADVTPPDHEDYVSRMEGVKKLLEDRVPKKIALLIASHFGGLEGPVNDANSVEERLRRFGFEVIRCCGTEATRTNILNSWDDLISKVKEDDVAIIFYSGCGGTLGHAPDLQRDVNLGPEDGTENKTVENGCYQFIAPFDCDGFNSGQVNRIYADEISTLIKKTTYKTRYVTVILDCSFSSSPLNPPHEGAIPKVLDYAQYQGLLDGQARLLQRRGAPEVEFWSIFESDEFVVMIFAAAESETAWEYVDEQGQRVGVFTKALVAAMDEAWTTGASWEEVLLEVRKQVNNKFPEQNPWFGGPCEGPIAVQWKK